MFLCGACRFSGDIGTGLLAALPPDPRLSAALQAMHQCAGHSWSVPELAAVSGLSRAAFARIFHEALGQPP